MRGRLQDRFDLSDDPAVDRLDSVLDVAAEVLGEYGPDPGSTRIERMARWLAYSMGGSPSHVESRAGVLTKYQVGNTGVTIVRAAQMIGIRVVDGRVPMTPDDARGVVVALLRIVEQIENDE